jgi:3-phenylpropionate/trans-cinnamate dioxygenase ferredoxin component
MTSWRKVCARREVKDGEPVSAKLDGTPIGIFQVGDALHAVHDVCTHEYALLSQGYQDGDVVECPLHAARFNVVTGRCLTAPATRDVAVFRVKVEGDDVLVALENAVT